MRVVTYLQIDQELKRAAKASAAAEGKTLSAYVCHALELAVWRSECLVGAPEREVVAEIWGATVEGRALHNLLECGHPVRQETAEVSEAQQCPMCSVGYDPIPELAVWAAQHWQAEAADIHVKREGMVLVATCGSDSIEVDLGTPSAKVPPRRKGGQR